MPTQRHRHGTGNFNAHLAQLLLFVADEAFWAGSKQDEESPTLFSENEQQMQDVPSRLVYQSFSNFVKNTQYGLAFSQAKFGKHLAKEMPCIKKQRKQVDGKRVYYYGFPSLEVMRDEFTKKTGIEFERDVVEAKPIKDTDAELKERLMLSMEAAMEKMDLPDDFLF